MTPNPELENSLDPKRSSIQCEGCPFADDNEGCPIGRMGKEGGSIVVAGLKMKNAFNGLLTDKLVFGEISMLGVLSSEWEDTERAMEILKRNWRELRKLCTHAYPIGQAETAVRLFGREMEDGPEPVHIHIDTTAAP